jgi:transcriptional regulator with XRE-family HTH domain
VIGKARKDADLPAAQVARRAGVDPATYSRIESGEIENPSFEALVRIARVLGVSLEELAGAVAPDHDRRNLAADGIRTNEALRKLRTQLRGALKTLDRLIAD